MIARYLVFFIFLVKLHFTHQVFAQQEGIYLEHDHYVRGEVSFRKEANKRYWLKVDYPFQTEKITICIGDSIYRLSKDTLFGYQDGDHNTFRFYGNREYKVLNHGEPLTLYMIEEINNIKVAYTSSHYFFSAGSNSQIFQLNKKNLKRAFPYDTAFHEQVALYFKYDDELINYDTYNKTYTINRIYNLYKKEK